MSMIIEVQHIPVEGKTLHYVRTADFFQVLRILEENGECRFPDPLSIELTAMPERNLIRVDGVISTTVELSCSRCLADFKKDLDHRFSLRFARETADQDGAVEKEVELDAEYIGLTFYTGQAIDFTATVQEQVVLSLPYKPLCSESCKGLCPDCGADMNAGPCGCRQDNAHNPFGILKSISWPAQDQEK